MGLCQSYLFSVKSYETTKRTSFGRNKVLSVIGSVYLQYATRYDIALDGDFLGDYFSIKSLISCYGLITSLMNQVIVIAGRPGICQSAVVALHYLFEGRISFLRYVKICS